MIKRASALVLLLSLVFFTHSLLLAWVPQVQSGQWAPIQTDPEGPPVTMGQPRDGAAAVLLPNGAVLITGGTDDTGTVLASTELFANGTFSTGMPMLEARSGHSATALPDGRVVVAGGVNAGGAALDTIEIYSPGTGEWTASGPMLTPRARHTTTLLKDGRLVVAGGENGTGAVDGIEVYDTNVGAVVAAGSLTSARAGHAAALLANGHVAILGGSNGAEPLATVDILDANGYLLNAGPAMPGARVGLAAVALLDGRVLIAGGNDGEADLASVLMFDGTAYTSAGILSVARRDAHALLLPHNNHVLIFGGRQSGARVLAAEMYRPWAGGFGPTGQPLAARADAAVSPLASDGVLLVAGGDGAASAEVYGFATLKTDDSDYSPGETVTMSGSGWVPGETVTLTLVESPQVHEDRTFTAVADGNGQFVNTDFVPELHHLGMRFYLTAVGSASQAQMTFTDAADLFWRGCTDTNWTTITNWRTSSGSNCSSNAASNYPGALSNDKANIESVGNQPVINTALPFSLSELKLPAGTTLTVAASGSITLQTDTTVFGTLNQTGGTITVASGKKIVIESGSGSASQSGGTMTVPLLEIKSGRTFTQSGASSLLSLNNGWKNEGTFTSTGGKVRLDSGATWQSPDTATNQFFDIEFDVAVTMNNQTISVAGDWQSDVLLSLTSNSPLVIFNGSGAQQITGTQNTTFSRVEVNKSAGDLTLTRNTSINTTLTFTSGNIVTGSNTVIIPSGGTVARTSGHVVGRLQRHIANGNAAAMLYHIGTAAAYTPATVDVDGTSPSPSVAGGLIARTSGVAHPNIGTSGFTPYVSRYWTLTTTGVSGTASVLNTRTYKLTVEFPSGEAGNPNLSEMRRWTGVAWATPLVTGTYTRTLTSTQNTNFGSAFSDFVVGTPDTTPPTVTSITRAIGSPTNQAFVTWTVTFSESVTGVNAADFALASTGLTGGPAITGVSGGPTVYNVTANTGNGTGTLGLNLNDDDTIIDGVGNKLGGTGAGNGSFTGQVYSVDRTLTPTITSQNKVYDGNTTATIVTRGFTSALTVTEDVDVFGGTATFDNSNAGTGKTVTATGLSLTGDDAGKYVLSSTSAATTADITQAGSTTAVTCPAGPYTYTGAAQTPCFVSVTGAGGLSLTPAANYSNNTNAGLATASYTFAGDTNHTGSSDSENFTIDKADATVTVTGFTGTYDATAHGATGTATGVGGADLSASLNLGATFTDVPGGTANWTFTGGTNYLDESGTAAIVITKADATVTVTGFTGVYDGIAHGASGTATGVGGADLSASLNFGATFTDVPGGTANWTFAGGTNYLDESGTADIVITKADATVTVTGFTGVYDGIAHGASGTATGVGGADLSAGLNFGATFTDVPGGTANWTFAGGPNYLDESGTAAIVITKADATVTVTGYTGVYDGTAHGATGTATGVGGADLSASLNFGATFTDVPGGTANWTFAGGPNYLDESGTAAIVITKADATVTVTGYTGVYDGIAHGASGTATGVGGADLSAGLNFGATFTDVPGGTANWTFAGGPNYLDESGTAAIVITKADATVTVTGFTGVYDATAHGATGTATGVGGADLSAGLNLGATFTDVPGGSANWTFAGGTNYLDESGTAAIVINKADATVTVTGFTGVYDAIAHGATGTATGVGGADLSAGLSLGASFTDVPGGTANWTFAGGTNYLDESGTAAIVITKASSTTVIACPVSVVYTGAPLTPCTATVTGAGGLNTTTSVTYANNVFVGTATATASYAGDSNHNGSTATPVTFAITTAYCFTGFLSPIGGSEQTSNGGSFADPVRAFKLGSTIPVKFLLNSVASGCSIPVTTGMHLLTAQKMSSGTDGDTPIDATPTDAATTGNQFRLTGSEWHFNLSTKGLSQGTWLLKATLQDGSVKTVWITIKK